MRPLAEVVPTRSGGYWGVDVGTSDVDAKAIRNGDVGTSGELRWSALPMRGYTTRELSKARVRASDIVLTSSGNCGNVAYIASEPAEPVVATNFVRILRVDPHLAEPRYVFNFLRSPLFRSELDPFVRGATIKNLSVEDAFCAIRMPTPPLPEQRRIAAILDHADALRDKRHQALTLLDALKRSIFAELLQAGGGRVELLGDVAHFFGGSSLPKGEDFQGQETGTLLMKVSDMNAPGNEERVFATALWTDGPTPRAATVPAGSVVLPKRGASIATNKKRMTSRRTSLDPNLMGIVPDEDRVLAGYLFAWFRSFDLASITSGSAVPQLNKQDLAPVELPVPALAEQYEFVERVELVSRVEGAIHRALVSDGELFDSLQSRAFGGEL